MNDEIIIEEDTNQDEILLDNDTVIYKQEKDYDKLDNKPSINNVELQGNKTLHDLGIQPEGNYVEQEQGKGLSTNDYTTREKEKLANLENYDDTEIKADIQELDTNKANKSETYTKVETDALLQDKADTEDIPDVSGFITKNVDDLVNYTKSSDMTNAINTAVGNETTARENSDVRLQNQIDAITSASDVVDVVGTYTDLQNYDTTKLTDKDLIKVMQDSTHNNALSYFRWLNNAWSYVGSEGPFYTKSETDTLLNEKQNEINSNNKLNADYVDDSNSGNKFVTTSEKQTWNNKLDEEDLTDYVKNTDYATSDKAGVIKANTNGFLISGAGSPFVKTYNYNEYQSMADYNFIGKRTLENVIVGKNLETADNKVTEINETNTDTQYPSAKAVHNKMANLGTTKTATGTSIDITDSAEGNMPLGIKGNTSQEENPSPSNPQEVKTVTGEVNVKVQNGKLNELSVKQGLYSIANNAQYEMNNTYVCSNNRIEVNGGKKILITSTKGKAGTYFILEFDENNQYIGYKRSESNITEYATTLGDNTKYILIDLGNGAEPCNPSNTGNFKLYLYNQEQNYPLNLGDIEFCKQDFPYKAINGNKYYDSLTDTEKSNLTYGKWYKHKEIEKVIYDGSENWNMNGNLAGCVYLINNSQLYGLYSTGNKIKTNLLTAVNDYDEIFKKTVDYGIFFGASTADRFVIRNFNFTTNTQYKEWLSNNNLIVYYVLSTPIEEEITEPTLIAQLEAIYNNAKSYEGETHIFTITENESPYIEAEYSIDNVENTLNKATSIDENSTNKEYPSAKAVYDYGQSIADKGEVYSTEEQVIGKWIDGKPLYRKVYQTTSGNVINQWNTLLIDNTIDVLVNMQKWYMKDNFQYPTQNDVSFNFYWHNTSYFLQEKHTNDYWNNTSMILTLEYTKTTD